MNRTLPAAPALLAVLCTCCVADRDAAHAPHYAYAADTAAAPPSDGAAERAADSPDPGEVSPRSPADASATEGDSARHDPGDAAPGVPDATGADDAGPSPPEPAPGSWQAPILVPALPFTHAADTAASPTSEAHTYTPCAPGTDESGAEVVYQLELPEEATLHLSVDDVWGDEVDVDLHVLSGPAPDACVARHDTALVIELAAGTWWVSVDTWVDASGAALAGAYVLEIEIGAATGGGPPDDVDPPPTGDRSDCLTSPLVCDQDDTPLVNGVPGEPAGVGGCPPGMARVAEFCVDRWEASLVVVDSAGELLGWSPYAHPIGVTVRAVSAPDLTPQGYIDQPAAAAACEAAGKRLCSDTEWLRACRGPNGTTFPYGEALLPGACNDDRACHPVVQFFESGADWVWSQLGHPCINQLPDGLAPTGSHPGCVTAEGLYDMMGNLHEWTADPAGTFRGGFYADTAVNGPGCLYATTAHNVWHWDYSTGFRCCASL